MTAPTSADVSSAEDLRALAAVVADFFAAQDSEAAVRAAMESGSYDDTVWQQMCVELGLTGLAVSESNGGSGGGLRELAVVLEEAGKSLFPSPLLSAGVAAWTLDEAVGSAAAVAWLPGLLAGTSLVTVAAGADACRVAVSCDKLTGVIPAVVDAAAADGFLVATTAGLYAVDSSATGVRIVERATIDTSRPIADVSFESAGAERIGDAVAADRLAAVAATAVACEQIGGAAAALEAAVAYAKIRHQFGAPIGSFQAIKHLCADLLLHVESGRAAVRRAARAVDDDDPQAEVFASIAKAWCSDAYAHAAESSLQIHGGIGFTWEHSAHLHLKRAKTNEFLFGDARHHRERLAQLLGLQGS